MSADHFVTAQHAAELVVLRMAVLAVLARATGDDQEVQRISVHAEADGFGGPLVEVEFHGAGGLTVGGLSL